MSDRVELWNDDEESDPRRHFQRERSQIMHPTLYISGVPNNINKDGLYNLFIKFGDIASVTTIPSKKIANSQIGFVTYYSMDSAQRAIQRMNLKPPFNFEVRMKLPKQEAPTFVRNSEPIGPKTGDRTVQNSSDYADGRANTDSSDSQRAYSFQKNIRESNNVSISQNQTQTDEFDNLKGGKGENSYLPRQNRKHITWGGVTDAASDIPKSEPKFRNYHNFSDDGRHEKRQERQLSNMAQRGMRGRNYAYQNAGPDPGFMRYPRNNGTSYRNTHRPDSECSSEESYGEFGAEANLEYDEAAEEFEDESTIAITITEKGRSIVLAPQLAPVTEVTTFSTHTSLSKRHEFSGGVRQEYDVVRDYEGQNHRQQFPEVSYNNHCQGMTGRQDRNFNANYNRQAQREYSSNMGFGDMKKPEQMKTDSEFIKQSNFQRDNKHRYQERKENCYTPRSNDHPIEARACNTGQHMPLTAISTPTTKVDQLPIRTPFKCVICHAENPDVLWIQRNVKELAGLTQQLTGLLRAPDNNFIPRINGVYLIEYNSSWYRGRIVQINRNGKYSVMLVDYGKIVGDISVGAMSLLSHANLNKPHFATKCKVCPHLIKKYINAIEILEAVQKAEITVIIERMNENLVIVNLDIPNEITSFSRPKPQHHGLKMKNNFSDPRATVSDLPENQFKIKDVATVVVVYAESAEHIVVCIEQNVPKFDELSKLLSNINAAGIPVYTPTKGELALAKFDDDDRWYRAEIMEICPDKSARVFFIDYGNKEKVLFKDIQPITLQALQYPQLGLIVSLFKAPESLQSIANKQFQMKVVNDRVNPILVEFLREPKVQNYFVSQHLKRAKIDLGPIKANFGIADEDAIFIIPTVNQDLISALKKFNETASVDNSSFEPRTGELCLAFSRDSWNRAACTSVLVNPKKFIVLLFDYGYTEEIDGVFLRPYAEEFVDFPMMAVKCVVEGYPSEKNIRDKIQSLESIDDDIEGDIIGIRKDYIEMQLI